MTITYSPKRIAVVLAMVVIVLGISSYLGNVVSFHPVLDNRGTRIWTRMFEMGRESSLPTWYQTFAMFFASLVLFAIAWFNRRTGGPFVKHWAGLGIIFLLFSIDEVAMVHERVGESLAIFFTGSGPLLYLWVIPGAIFVLVVGLSYLRFVGHLPRDIKVLVVVAGAIFVGGALGVEMISAWYEDNHGVTLTYRLLDTTEELMEKLGIVIFIYALLTYFQRAVPELRFVPAEAPDSEVRRAEQRSKAIRDARRASA